MWYLEGLQSVSESTAKECNNNTHMWIILILINNLSIGWRIPPAICRHLYRSFITSLYIFLDHDRLQYVFEVPVVFNQSFNTLLIELRYPSGNRRCIILFIIKKFHANLLNDLSTFISNVAEDDSSNTFLHFYKFKL